MFGRTTPNFHARVWLYNPSSLWCSIDQERIIRMRIPSPGPPQHKSHHKGGRGVMDWGPYDSHVYCIMHCSLCADLCGSIVYGGGLLNKLACI